VGHACAAAPARCPDECLKKVHIYNNTDGPIWLAFQAGIQDPDPWLQAAFANASKTYAETHYSRVYVNLDKGIPARGSVTVTLPWFSKLEGDTDLYADWWNGGRMIVFDSQDAVTKAHRQDEKNKLRTAAGSLQFSCDGCTQPMNDIFSDTKAYADGIPFQLLEHTFVNVKSTVSPPEIINFYVGYNISYLDQVYLPIALAPCLKEPCKTDGTDKSAVGYLGTIVSFKQFRDELADFQRATEWPRYNGALDSVERPRLPGTYNLLTDALAHATNPQHESLFTPDSWKSDALKRLVSQWTACTSTMPTEACPQADFYKDVATFFRNNFTSYLALTGCQGGFPRPQNLNGEIGQLFLMQYVYGWVPFNSFCTNKGAGVNALNPKAPNFYAPFSKAINEYIQLQYNFDSNSTSLQQQFNPFTSLVHGEHKLNANSYAFSVDDAAGFQSNPGQGLVIAIGGSKGLPNNIPVPKPADFNTDFEVNLADTFAQKRPAWKKYGVCSTKADIEFPPFPPGQTNLSRTIVVQIATKGVPCPITVEDAAGQTYRIDVTSKVPWAAWPGRGFDPKVMSCPRVATYTWCQNQINELAIPDAPRFALLTGPSCLYTGCNPF
jgi:hypothetical protein